MISLASLLLLLAVLFLAGTTAVVENLQDIQQTDYPLPNTLRGSEYVNAYLIDLIDNMNADAGFYISYEKIGISQRGVPIYMFTIAGSQTEDNGSGGIMIIARQHGDEPAGTRATVKLIRDIALGDTDITHDELSGVVLRIVPMANPDGMDMFQRKTVNGSDMNRDWLSKRLPETRAVASAIEWYQPDLLLDLHELTPKDRDEPHIVGIPPRHANGYLLSIKQAFREQGTSIRTQNTERHNTRSLLHRYFAHKHNRPAFLVESRYTGDPATNLDSRTSFHLTTIMAVLDEYGRNTNQSKR